METGPYLNIKEAAAFIQTRLQVRMTERQVRRAAEPDRAGHRKLPFFPCPVTGKLLISQDKLIKLYSDAETRQAPVPRRRH